MRSAPSLRTHLHDPKKIELAHLFEELMRADLAIQTINKTATQACDRVKQEITEAEAELKKLKKKHRTQQKHILKEKISKKKNGLVM